MGTRANVIFRDKQGDELIIYHHYDGYPEGLGKILCLALNDFRDFNCGHHGGVEWANCLLESSRACAVMIGLIHSKYNTLHTFYIYDGRGGCDYTYIVNLDGLNSIISCHHEGKEDQNPAIFIHKYGEDIPDVCKD